MVYIASTSRARNKIGVQIKIRVSDDEKTKLEYRHPSPNDVFMKPTVGKTEVYSTLNERQSRRVTLKLLPR